MNLAKCISVVSLALGALAPFGAARAQDVFVGSWALDTAKSPSPTGTAPTGGTLQITDAGGGKYTSVSEASVGGVTVRSEITYSIDGQDYAVTTTPAQPGTTITQSMERVSDTVYNSNVKVNGQLVATAVTELSGDRNTLTQTSTGVGQFAALSSTVVFQRK